MFAFIPYCCVLGGEAANTSFIIIGVTFLQY
jgi:hypothetical protein